MIGTLVGCSYEEASMEWVVEVALPDELAEQGSTYTNNEDGCDTETKSDTTKEALCRLYEECQNNSNNDEYVIVRVYYHSVDLDPNFELLPEAYLYNIEIIPKRYFREGFIELVHRCIGISILDLWFEHDKLYVDLSENEMVNFDTSGSLGALDRGIRLHKTLASIPGISYFETLVGGQRGVSVFHHNFGGIGVVKNGGLYDVVFR